jgi:hypothetical protein
VKYVLRKAKVHSIQRQLYSKVQLSQHINTSITLPPVVCQYWYTGTLVHWYTGTLVPVTFLLGASDSGKGARDGGGVDGDRVRMLGVWVRGAAEEHESVQHEAHG